MTAIRMAKEARREQLLERAWKVVREEGTDALSLARLASAAGVTKPIAYEHFGSRAGLLAALYREHDARQSAQMRQALRLAERSLAETARVLAQAYVDCAVSAGIEIMCVRSALAGAPELEAVKRDCDAAFEEDCRQALEPLAAPGQRIEVAQLVAILGAAESLGDAAAAGRLSKDQAERMLAKLITGLVRSDGTS